MLRHPERSGQLTIPYHSSKEVKKGLLKAVLKQADINLKEQ
jgi:predicted RNA binding protein YcfA (HicA-like mRNA interferase family)